MKIANWEWDPQLNGMRVDINPPNLHDMDLGSVTYHMVLSGLLDLVNPELQI